MCRSGSRSAGIGGAVHAHPAPAARRFADTRLAANTAGPRRAEGLSAGTGRRAGLIGRSTQPHRRCADRVLWTCAMTDPASWSRQPSPIAVLLVNLGSPDAPEPAAVRRYLREFLSD